MALHLVLFVFMASLTRIACGEKRLFCGNNKGITIRHATCRQQHGGWRRCRQQCAAAPWSALVTAICETEPAAETNGPDSSLPGARRRTGPGVGKTPSSHLHLLAPQSGASKALSVHVFCWEEGEDSTDTQRGRSSLCDSVGGVMSSEIFSTGSCGATSQSRFHGAAGALKLR